MRRRVEARVHVGPAPTRTKRRLSVAEKVHKRVQAKTEQAQKSRRVNAKVKELRAKAKAAPV